MRTRYFSFLGAFLMLSAALFLRAAAPEDTDIHQLEGKLRQAFTGRVATFRNFYADKNLEFDDHGKLLSHSKTGSWTNYGRIQVSSVKLNKNSLVISGNRDVAEWDQSAHEFKDHALDTDVRITVHMQPGYSKQSVLDAIDSIFVTRGTFLSDLVPDYWKELLATERQRHEEWTKHKSEEMKGVLVEDPGIAPPKLLSKSEGIQTSLAPFTDPQNNEVVLSYVVEESGGVKLVEIVKPIGLGVDDPIAEAISKWKYEPATRNGHPTAVLMYARYLVKTPSGRVDPYHTQACPGIENLFAC